MEPLNRSQLSSSLESGTLTKELVASATINGVSATVPVTVCPHARVACGFRSDGVERIEWFVIEVVCRLLVVSCFCLNSLSGSPPLKVWPCLVAPWKSFDEKFLVL